MADKLVRIIIPGIMDAEIEVEEAMLAEVVAEYIAEHPVSVTVDSELSGTSENPVQNKVVKLALDQKGTYSKPSGGIPKTDLDSAVRTSLGKADTAVQSTALEVLLNSYATKLFVEGKGYQTATQVQTAIAAIPDELPTVTATDNGKFLRVVSGAWAAETVQTWQGGSY